MKSKKKIILAIIIFIGLISIILSYFLCRIATPTEIYKKAMNNVVELKAQNDESFVSYGTAELINSKGEFISNTHVVTYTSMGIVTAFNNYYIRFSFEDDYREVELIKYDLELDLAQLRFKEMPNFKLKPIKLGNSSKLNSGDTVYAVGNSQNYGISISKGMVGIPLINIEYDGKTRGVMQCDLTITEGNSGGALLDSKGRLVGITTFRLKDSKGNVIYGIAYCIPVNIVMQFLSE